MKKTIGITLLALPLIALATFSVVVAGWAMTLLAYSVIVAAIGLIWAGVVLLTPTDPQ